MSIRTKIAAAAVALAVPFTVAAFAPQAQGSPLIPLKIRAWNGQCLSINSASRYAPVFTTGCAHAHTWWLFEGSTFRVTGYANIPNGTFRPTGHADVAIGDSGNRLVVVVLPAQSQVLVDAVKQEPPGVRWQRFYFSALGARGHWHANGFNQGVTVQRDCSLACYYSIIPG